MENFKSTSAMKLLKLLTILLSIVQLTSCKGQNKEGVTYPKEKIMSNEKFDIEKFNKCFNQEDKVYNEDCKQILSDGTVVIQSIMSEDYRQDIIPVAPGLLSRVKLFYLKTGILKQEYETYVGGYNDDFGISKFYDQKGYLTKTVDENIKYKDVQIKLLDLFEILKKEPLLDKLSEDEKEHFNTIFSLGKENKKVNLEDIFNFLKRDKILNPYITDTSVLDTEDRFRLQISFDQDKENWNVTKELYPFGQIWLKVDANTGKVSDKEYHREMRP